MDDTLQSAGLNLWIGLDRLDVAFAESLDLEKNALRALFKVYLDLMAYRALHLKIFLAHRHLGRGSSKKAFARQAT